MKLESKRYYITKDKKTVVKVINILYSSYKLEYPVYTEVVIGLGSGYIKGDIIKYTRDGYFIYATSSYLDLDRELSTVEVDKFIMLQELKK